MKFPEKAGNGPVKKWLNFGDDPDHESISGSRYGSGYGSGYGSVSRHVPWRRYALSQWF